jgi:hypothetical protein
MATSFVDTLAAGQPDKSFLKHLEVNPAVEGSTLLTNMSDMALGGLRDALRTLNTLFVNANIPIFPSIALDNAVNGSVILQRGMILVPGSDGDLNLVCQTLLDLLAEFGPIELDYNPNRPDRVYVDMLIYIKQFNFAYQSIRDQIKNIGQWHFDRYTLSYNDLGLDIPEFKESPKMKAAGLPLPVSDSLNSPYYLLTIRNDHTYGAEETVLIPFDTYLRFYAIVEMSVITQWGTLYLMWSELNKYAQRFVVDGIIQSGSIVQAMAVPLSDYLVLHRYPGAFSSPMLTKAIHDLIADNHLDWGDAEGGDDPGAEEED